MKKLLAACLLISTLPSAAQTLFTYANEKVTVPEFLSAYQKNNYGPKTQKSLRDYLDLYIASKLKIAEAKSLGLDTSAQMRADLDNLKQQIIPNYLNDSKAIDRLTNEAFARSQKDVHAAHIFVSFGRHDSATAARRLRDIQSQLAKGTAFEKVAAEWSDDPQAAVNGGDLGWITVFTLPYALENLAYTTRPGQYSKVYTSRAGYHIVKNLGERRSKGKMKAAQILLAFPPNADEQTKMELAKRADSLYNRILKGDAIGDLATKFSNDVVSAASNGIMPEFGSGQYSAEFEDRAFGLAKDGEVSKPFLTSYGYHIVQRLGRTEVATSLSPKDRELLRARVESNDRAKTTRSLMAKRIMKEGGYKKLLLNDADLWLFSDSILSFRAIGRPLKVNYTTPLYSLDGTEYNVADWINYAQTFRYKTDGTGFKTYDVLWDEFLENMTLNYYQNNLEDFNPDFKKQVTEFSDGNLFFEIMQQKVWGPAQTDSAALETYYGANRKNYIWNKSADAVVFYATDKKAAETFIRELKKSPADWRKLVPGFNETISADSARYNLAQLAGVVNGVAKAGDILGPVASSADQSATITYVIRTYDQPQQRSFEEARGMVINDYQQALEKQWVDSLKRKYPVKVNQESLKKVLATAR